MDWEEDTARDRFPFASITMLPLDNTKEEVDHPRLSSVQTTRKTSSAKIALVRVRVLEFGTRPFTCRTHSPSPSKDKGQRPKQRQRQRERQRLKTMTKIEVPKDGETSKTGPRRHQTPIRNTKCRPRYNVSKASERKTGQDKRKKGPIRTKT